MSDAISSILSQIRAHESRAGAMSMRGAEAVVNRDQISPELLGRVGGVNESPGFSQTLSNAIDKVSATQMNAASLQKAFELGDPRADLARVMVSMQESQVAFRATVEVRNRLVQAYQDVMNMPI